MFHIVLYEPEIPPNTGNIIRLCANTGSILHLIHPLGFTLSDRQLKRAGVDYDESADIREYNSLDECLRQIDPGNVYAVSTRGAVSYADISYCHGDVILFGPETRGLPEDVLTTFPGDKTLKIPMQKYSRSLNLSNAVSVILYEALRQNDFRFTPHGAL